MLAPGAYRPAPTLRPLAAQARPRTPPMPQPAPGAAVPGGPATAAPRAPHDPKRGLAIVALGVLVFTPDALVMRLVDIDAFALAVWRGLIGGLVMTAGCLVAFGAGLPRAIAALGRWGLVLMALEATTTVLFCLSIMWTNVANAMLAFAATPMLAALIARLTLGERIPAPTALAIAAVASGLGFVAWGARDEGAVSLAGVLAGLGSALAIAGFFVILRRLKAQSATPVIGPGWLLGALLALPFATFEPMSPAQWSGVFLTAGLIMPLAIALITWGSRQLPAAETSMMTLLEVVAGPILVWLVLGEDPGPWTLAGGAVVLTALAAHSAWRLRRTPAVAPA